MSETPDQRLFRERKAFWVGQGLSKHAASALAWHKIDNLEALQQLREQDGPFDRWLSGCGSSIAARLDRLLHIGDDEIMAELEAAVEWA